jgi:hypothetical protein
MSSAQNSDADREDYVVCVLEFAGDRGAATAALQRVFGLNEPDASALLSEVPVAVRRGVNRIRAEYFRRALELRGARVEVRDGEGEVVQAQAPGRAQPSGPLTPRAQPLAAKPIAAPSAQPKPAGANATIAGAGPMAAPLSAAAKPLALSQSGKTLALGGIAANDLRAGAANDAGRVSASAGGWGDLEPRKPANRGATQKIEPPTSTLDRPAAHPFGVPAGQVDAPKPANREREEPLEQSSEQADAWALSLGEEAGPLDSPLEPLMEGHAVELASMPSPGQRAPQRAAEGPPTLDFDENTLGPSLELRSDPRNLQRESAPRYEPIPKGERWKAPGTDTLAKARRKQDLHALESGFSDGRSAPAPSRGPAAPHRLSDAHSSPHGPAAARARVSGGHATADEDPSGIHSAVRRPPFVSSAISRPHAARNVELGFWEATKLGFSGTSISWIAKIAGAAVVLAGLAQLSVRVPALGLPLLLIGLTCVLGLCSEYHKYVFWAAATREESLQERPALSVAMMMRDGVHLTCFALISQLLVWFWLAGQLQAAHRPLAVVFSPSLWVLGFGPGFYWPIAIACAAAQNRASAVWDLPLGLRALGRAPGEVAVVVLATAAAFMLSMMVAAAVVSATSLDPTLALFTAAGLPVAITHALAGAWMGRVVHQHPDLFE